MTTLEYKCPTCGEWSASTEWRETYVGCEICGDHLAKVCPKCGDVHDEVFVDLETSGG